jgi:hypothetical protein
MSYKDEELKERFTAVKPILSKNKEEIKEFEEKLFKKGIIAVWKKYPGQMIIRVVYKILNMMYISFYFYFMPYLTAIISFLYVGYF